MYRGMINFKKSINSKAVYRWLSIALRRGPRFSMLIILVLIICTLVPNLLAPHSPSTTSLYDQYQPPVGFGGTWTHPLGTDALGRDLLSRAIFGVRVALIVAAATVFIGGGIGTLLGLIAGYRGGFVDAIVMRAVDSTISIPIILLALLFAVVFGPGIWNIVVVLSLLIWARYARLVRGEVLSIKNRDFVTLAKVAGASPVTIVLRHIFPNTINAIVVYSTLEIGWVILTEAALSFLGAGVPPPTPAWGSMVAEGRDVIGTAWWVSIVPGMAILVTVLALNLFGDWLRDYMDPRLRHV